MTKKHTPTADTQLKVATTTRKKKKNQIERDSILRFRTFQSSLAHVRREVGFCLCSEDILYHIPSSSSVGLIDSFVEICPHYARNYIVHSRDRQIDSRRANKRFTRCLRACKFIISLSYALDGPKCTKTYIRTHTHIYNVSYANFFIVCCKHFCFLMTNELAST